MWKTFKGALPSLHLPPQFLTRIALEGCLKKKEDTEENGSLKLLSRSIYCESIQKWHVIKIDSLLLNPCNWCSGTVTNLQGLSSEGEKHQWCFLSLPSLNFLFHCWECIWKWSESKQTCPLIQPWLKCRTESQETGLAQPSRSISTPTHNTCDVYPSPWCCLYPSSAGMRGLYEGVRVTGLWEPCGMKCSQCRADGRTHLHLRWVLRQRHCVCWGLPLAVGGSGCAKKHSHGALFAKLPLWLKRLHPLEEKFWSLGDLSPDAALGWMVHAVPWVNLQASEPLVFNLS